MEPEWSQLRNVWYRKVKISEMQWALPPKIIRIIPAPFGGPIAVLYTSLSGNLSGMDPATHHQSAQVTSKRQTMQNSAANHQLRLYSALGRILKDIPWSYDYPLPVLDWGLGENLVCVFQSGLVRILSALGDLTHTFPVEPASGSFANIIAGKCHSQAVALLSSSMTVYIGIDLPKTQTFIRCPNVLDVLPVSLCLLVCPNNYKEAGHLASCASGRTIPSNADCSKDSAPTTTDSDTSKSPGKSPEFSDVSETHSQHYTRSVGVLVAAEASDHLRFISPGKNTLQIPIQQSPIEHLIVSPSSKYVLAMCSSSQYHVFAVSFHEDAVQMLSLLCVNSITVSLSPFTPGNVAWVGDDCLACHSKLSSQKGAPVVIHIGGTDNIWTPFVCVSPTRCCIFVSEVDGLRIVTSTETFRIEKAPQSSVRANAPCSNAPAALLRAAYAHKDVALTQNTLLELRPHLHEAILDCCDASLYEHDMRSISSLFETALVGRCILSNYQTLFRDQLPPDVDTAFLKEEGSKMLSNSGSHDVFSAPQLEKLVTKCCVKYMRCVLDLRILNNLFTQADLPLTIQQCRHLGCEMLLEILSKRELHQLALNLGILCKADSVGRTQVLAYQIRHRENKLQGVPDMQTSSFLRAESPQTTHGSMALQLLKTQDALEETMQVIHELRCRHSDASNYQIIGSQRGYTIASVLQHYVLTLVKQELKVAPLNDKVSDTPFSKGNRQHLFETITSLLEQYDDQNVQVYDIALYLHKSGLPDSASGLIHLLGADHAKVRALLAMKKYSEALHSAVEFKKSEYLYEWCIATEPLKTDLNDSTIKSALETYLPLTKYFYHINVRSPKELSALYERNGFLLSAAYAMLASSLCSPEIDTAQLTHASVLFASVSKPSASSRCQVLNKLCLEHVELMNYQKAYDQKNPNEPPLYQMSLAQTLLQLYKRESFQEIDALNKLFKLTPRQLLVLKVKALIQMEKYDAVVALAQNSENQSVLGADAFVRLLKSVPDQQKTGKAISSVSLKHELYTEDSIAQITTISQSSFKWRLPRLLTSRGPSDSPSQSFTVNLSPGLTWLCLVFQWRSHEFVRGPTFALFESLLTSAFRRGPQ